MMENDRLTRIDILLLLLHAPGPTKKINEPIIGKTRLQKELFLAQKQLCDEKVKRPYPFMPYKIGPYSRELYNDIAWLVFRGLVEERRSPMFVNGIYHEFRLTHRGISEAENIIRERRLERIYDTIGSIKQKFNQMDLTGLVELTHRLFPEYVRTE